MTRSSGRSRPPSDSAPPRGRRSGRPLGRTARLAAPVVLLLVSATGCSVPNFGFLPGITVQSKRVLNLWKGSAIAALVVGCFVWGLILWAVIAYRKRNDELPRQVRYNLPVEVLYTVVPFVIIAGLFYYTARDEIYVNKTTKNPAVTINVIGFRWNWQFRYLDTAKNNTPPLEVTGRPGEPAVLVLPTQRTIRFIETSPDVIHSFWVPEFLFKRDVIPGRQNQFELTINRTGTFIGRCAELCGTDHDRMNFYVKVVGPAEYDRFIAQRTLGGGATVAVRPGTTSGSAQ